MKLLLAVAPAALLFPILAPAAITVPGADGSDGALVITQDTTIDLSLAATGAWDANNASNPGNGIYDAEKWAVVFKYSTVSVAAGATLTFSNHPSKAPVVWLVSGNVSVFGNVNLHGQDGVSAPALAEPAPGGFRGGHGDFSAGVTDGAGFGPGGGFRQAQGGVYEYGNPSLVPLIGGSGGSGPIRNDGSPEIGGGAGGGALLVASAGTITIDGSLAANGGDGFDTRSGIGQLTGGGSGGGIRLICSDLVGSGNLRALAGNGGAQRAAGLGRIRIERETNSNSISAVPDPSVVPLANGATALLWPPATAPEIKIVSIGGVAAPADPRASFGTFGSDVALPETDTTSVVIETTNVEQASQLKVRVTPRATADATVTDAVVDSVVSTTPLVIRWTADLPVTNGYSALQVRVIRP